MATELKEHDIDTGHLPKNTLGLQKRFIVLRPIRNKSQYRLALSVLNTLSVIPNLSEEQNDYLEVLSDVVGRYEDENFKFEKQSPLEILKFLLEENGMNGSDLGRLLGSRTLGSAILRGDRELSKTHILLLANHFSVEPSLFIG